MNKSRKTTRIYTLLNHQNKKTLEQINQEKNLVRQIHAKNNQEDWRTSQNENCEKTTIVSRTDLCVIDNKKEDDKMTSWWCTDRTFWNWQNDETNFQKLLFFTNETESEETYLTMWAMSEKQVKMT